MKTFTKIITASCLIAAVTSCSSDMPVTESRIPRQEASIDNNKRSMEDIIAIAYEYGKLKASQSRSGQMTVTRNSVVPVLGTGTRAESDTLLYAVNYPDDNGYLIVSAEKTTEPILAMIDNGSFNDSSMNRNEGLEFFVDCANRYVKSSKIKILDSVPDYRLQYYRDTIKSVSVSGPRLKTMWNQKWPENMYCPNKVAGCAPVAIAQVISYFRPSLNLTLTFEEKPCNTLAINWDELLTHTQSTPYRNPTQQEIDKHIAECSKNYNWHHQLGALVRQIGVWSESEYNLFSTNTSSDKTWEVCNRLLAKQNKTYISGTGFYNKLQNGGIALIGGQSDEGGHAWVLDGTGVIQYDCWTYYGYDPITRQYYSRELNQYTSRYVHCNWGWGGDDNGYFLEDVYDTSKGIENLTRYNFNKYIEGYVYQ